MLKKKHVHALNYTDLNFFFDANFGQKITETETCTKKDQKNMLIVSSKAWHNSEKKDRQDAKKKSFKNSSFSDI